MSPTDPSSSIHAQPAAARRLGLHAVLAVSLMVVVSLVAWWLQPRAASRGAPEFALEALFPKALPGWRLEQGPANVIINPQLQASVDKLYSQVLTRTYINDKGYRIMLSVAYGNDQRGDLQAHYPDLCYPAQGFKVLGSDAGLVPLGAAEALRVRRLQTELGARKEPLSYWFVYGQRLLSSSAIWQKRLIDVQVGLQGRIADGLLVRVSSIDSNTEAAYQQQDAFVRVLVDSIAPTERRRVIGEPQS
jgi:EpsI family protein